MKAKPLVPPSLYCAIVLCEVLLQSVFAQPLQREWVRNYFNVQTNSNQATAIAIAPDGNVVVAGTSQNTNGDLDYYVIKYKPNGDQAWSTRYDSTNSGKDQLRAMTIDPNGNIIVTGTTDTVKFNAAGAFVWSQPLGGRAIIANAEHVYVTGFSETDIATAQLQNNNVDGKELWRRTIDGPVHGIDVGQAITLDLNGNVCVAGQEDQGCVQSTCYRPFAVVSYMPNGDQRIFGTVSQPPSTSVQANSIRVDRAGFVYVYGTYFGLTMSLLAKFDQTGTWVWGNEYGGTFGSKMILDSTTEKVILTGRTGVNAAIGSEAAMMHVFSGVEPSGTQPIWKDASSPGNFSEGSDLVQDSLGNVYIAGYSANNLTSKAMLLAKVTISGQQLGLDRYNSPNAGSNIGTALAIDRNDNVYVTGYVQNTQGGSEFVTIKYTAAPKIEKEPSGAMHLEFHTSPSQQYTIEGTSDFFNWQSLITDIADANGVIQFDDTNAPTIPFRFYRGKQP